MIDSGLFYKTLTRLGIDFFTGVPDSTLKSFCAFLHEHADSQGHIIAANEGGAIALACGHYLATGRPGLVYMQNSGQGNAVNPLVSLADPVVYSVPLLLLIAWRGEPGKHDEPQHIKQGKITLSLLDVLEVPYKILPDNTQEAQVCLEEIVRALNARKGPVALIVRKGTFEPRQMEEHDYPGSDLTREEAIEAVINDLDKSEIIVSTTGKISRELYGYRDRVGGCHGRDFLTIGSMGHCSQIALGIALAKPERQVYCLDGDGAVIMQMGAVAIIGSTKAKNFRHIVFNNGCHDSAGGLATCGFAVSLTDIAMACGYALALQAQTKKEIDDTVGIMKTTAGPAMLEVRIKKGAREDLGRPKYSPKDIKTRFMEFLAD